MRIMLYMEGLSLKEDSNHRYRVIIWENGKEEERDSCDLMSAESLAIEAEELKIPVHWIYVEDRFYSPA
jgi:hypothetical protein